MPKKSSSQAHPYVSVLMPAYNVEKYIGEAIESILAQTFSNFELIIVDDHSTDATWEIVREYQTKDSRILAHQNAHNQGIPTNRNTMIGLARGQYIAWQDSDDISVPARLEMQSQFLDLHPEVGIVGGSLQFFNEQGVLSVRSYPADDATLREMFFRFMPVSQPAAMVRKEVLLAAGTYNTNYHTAEDLDLLFRIASYSQLANLQEVVLMYRKNSSSSTYSRLKEMEKNTLRIRLKYAYKQGYNPSVSDIIFNLLQFITLHALPAETRLKMVDYIRNRKAF